MRKNRLNLIRIGLALMLVLSFFSVIANPKEAKADTVMDYQVLQTGTSSSRHNYEAQIITPGSNYSLSRVELFAYADPGQNISTTLWLESTSGGVPTGTHLGTSQAVTISGPPTNIYSYSFATPVSLTAGTVYALVLDQRNQGSHTIYLWEYNSSDNYSGGREYYSTNSSDSTGWTAYTANQDMEFICYAASGTLSGTTNGVTALSSTGATMSGTLISLDASGSITCNFQFGTTTGYGTDSGTVTLTSPGSFTAAVTGLTAGTTYHYRAKFVGNSTVYGSDVTFTTSTVSSTYTAPVVTTNAATVVTADSATLNATVTSLGSASSIMTSFKIGMDTSYGMGTYFASPAIMTGTGSYSFILTGLSPSTTYHYQAVCEGDIAGNGLDASFTTSTNVLGVITGSATSDSATSAALTATVTGLGDSSNVKVYIRVTGSVSSFIFQNSIGTLLPGGAGAFAITVPGYMTSGGIYTGEIAGLQNGGTYYYGAVVVGSSTVYGSVASFTQYYDPTKPSVTTGSFIPDGTSSMQLTGVVNSMGSNTQVTVHIEVGGPGSPTSEWLPGNAIELDSKTLSAPGSFSSELTTYNGSALQQDTTYDFRAVVVGGSNTVYGSVIHAFFHFVAADPIVTTVSAASTDGQHVTLKGNLSSLGANPSVLVSLQWVPDMIGDLGTSPNNLPVQTMYGTGDFTATVDMGVYLPNLDPNNGITIYYRAVAQANDVVYGSTLSYLFNPPAKIPVPTQQPITSAMVVDTLGWKPAIDGTYDGQAMELDGRLDVLGKIDTVAVGFQIGTSTSYGYVTLVKNMTGVGTFYLELDHLQPATSYCFRAIAYGDGIAYGQNFVFTTSSGSSPTSGLTFSSYDMPVVTTNTSPAIDVSSATLSGTLGSIGHYGTIALGFQVGPTYDMEFYYFPIVSTATGDYTKKVVGLNSNTTYYYRAAAIGGGIVFGASKSLLTIQDATPAPPGSTPGNGGIGLITPAPPGGSGEPGATPPTDIIVQVNKTVASWGWGSQGAHWILVIICMAVTFWMFFPIPLLRITVPLLVFGAGFVSGFLDQYLIIIAGVLFAVKLVQGLLTGNLLGVDLGRMGRQGRDVGDSSPPARVPGQHWSLWRRGGKK